MTVNGTVKSLARPVEAILGHSSGIGESWGGRGSRRVWEESEERVRESAGPYKLHVFVLGVKSLRGTRSLLPSPTLSSNSIGVESDIMEVLDWGRKRRGFDHRGSAFFRDVSTFGLSRGLAATAFHCLSLLYSPTTRMDLVKFRVRKLNYDGTLESRITVAVVQSHHIQHIQSIYFPGHDTGLRSFKTDLGSSEFGGGLEVGSHPQRRVGTWCWPLWLFHMSSLSFEEIPPHEFMARQTAFDVPADE